MGRVHLFQDILTSFLDVIMNFRVLKQENFLAKPLVTPQKGF
jgi:hypothetical protein